MVCDGCASDFALCSLMDLDSFMAWLSVVVSPGIGHGFTIVAVVVSAELTLEHFSAFIRTLASAFYLALALRLLAAAGTSATWTA